MEQPTRYRVSHKAVFICLALACSLTSSEEIGNDRSGQWRPESGHSIHSVSRCFCSIYVGPVKNVWNIPSSLDYKGWHLHRDVSRIMFSRTVKYAGGKVKYKTNVLSTTWWKTNSLFLQIFKWYVMLWQYVCQRFYNKYQSNLHGNFTSDFMISVKTTLWLVDNVTNAYFINISAMTISHGIIYYTVYTIN